MGNTCVGPSLSKNGFFQSVSATIWRSRNDDKDALPDTNGGSGVHEASTTSSKSVTSAPEPLMIEAAETKPSKDPDVEINPRSENPPASEQKKPAHSRKASNVAGLLTDSVLRRQTDNLKDIYSLGRKLGQGQFGTTYLCVEKATGKEYACKSILKRKLTTEEDVEDVRREIQIMHHLSGHPNVISIKGAYEDVVAVHVVMELCAGGELFDRIIQRGHYTERKAAELTRVIVGVLETCHSLGVMHRDLKPENFLFVNQTEEAPLKTIDFGLSIFFRPGEIFTDVVGSPYYVAPEVLKKRYGPEADVWSAGVIIYILLSGVPPFWAETEQGIFEEVLHGKLDFKSEPWPSISNEAKDLVWRMLIRDPKKRLTAHEVLCHPWVQVDGVAPDKPLDSAVLSRMKQFSAMNKLKKMALRVIAENLSEDEIAGLKEMFKMIDTDNSGQITYEELKAGLEKVGSNLQESEIYALMQAADVDNSGTIDYKEFITATLHLNKIEKEDHLFAAFSYFDKDGSGYITADELQNACQEFGIEDVRLDEMIREVDQDNDRRVVGVFWDFRSAKFAGGPEPLSGYYVAVVCDDEVALLIGDCKKEAYKKTKARPAAEEATLVTKRENVFGKKCFSTRARFDAGRKKEHDIVVENSISGSKEPEMWISVDGVVAIHVSNLQWKFRGNETVFVETVPLQVFWDVHDWLFKGPGYAFFIFKPGLPGEKSPTVTPTESRGDGDGDGDDNDDSPMSIESSRNWSCSLASEELCFFLYAWKAE